MSHIYRKNRYISGTSSKKEKYHIVIITVLFFLISVGVIVYQWKDMQQLKDSASNQLTLIKKFEQELGILRTLNPYHVEANEVLANAVANVDLFPGWVARVYPIPPKANKANLMNDLGSFVMNETRFTLSSHKRYGIPQLKNGMYRLNGLFPSYKKGRLQVGVEFYLDRKKQANSKERMSQICSCYARIDINNKRVIDKKLHIVTQFQHEQVLTGEVELAKGVYPISAVLYCDEKSDFVGDDVHVSISFRDPTQYSLTSHRNSIFHIYKPENFTAKL